MRGDGEPLRSWLLGGLIVVAAWRPPELDPLGLLLTTVFAAGLGWFLLASGPDALGLRRFPPLALLLTGTYLVASCFVASAPHPARSFLCGLVPAGIAFAAARAARREGSDTRPVETALMVAAAGAALQGIYQALSGLDQTARALRNLGLPALDSLVVRAEGGRAFGPFLLPSSLGIFLAMAMPIPLGRMLERRTRPGIRAAWAALALLFGLGLAASRSYGAVLSLGGAALLLVACHPMRRRGRLTLLGIGAVSASLALAIFAGRGSEGMSPLALRMGNWRAAGRIFLDHPLLGVGFGNFRDYYPSLMKPGMNESAYAHSSYLQAASEGGTPALLAVITGALLLGGACVGQAGPGPRRLGRALLVLPPLTFLVHNLVDFSAYLPSLLVAFAALAGSVPRWERRGPGPAPVSGRDAKRSARWLLAATLLGWAAVQAREAWVGSLMARARWDLALGRVEAAVPLLERAAAVDPGHPDPPAALGEILLAAEPDDARLRARGEEYARRAVSLRPRRAFGHLVLSRYRLAAGDPTEAFVEVTRARKLYPTRAEYVEESERLREYLMETDREEHDADAP